MSLKSFLVLNAILFIPFGIFMIIMPGILFPFFEINLDADGLLMARVFGSALANIGLMCYLVRDEPRSSIGIKAILFGNLFFHAIDAFSTGAATYLGTMNLLGIMFTGLHFFLALGFLYYLYSRSDS